MITGTLENSLYDIYISLKILSLEKTKLDVRLSKGAFEVFAYSSIYLLGSFEAKFTKALTN